MYSIQADNTDYVEIVTSYRAEAAVTALSSFVSKFSMGIGGAKPRYLLAAVGFDENLSTQDPAVNMAIICCVIVFPAIFAILSFLIMGILYPLNKEKLEQQEAQIRKRHSSSN